MTDHNYGAGIFPQHAAMLAASGIDPDVARERGTTSVDTKVMLDKLGIAKAGQNVPGLLFPIHSVTGQVSCQYRPDEPRVNAKGKPLKYEAPVGQSSRLDLHPRTHPHLKDLTQPVIVTEGAKKVDAVLSTGWKVVVGFAGVENWANKTDGWLPDWLDVPVGDGRTVYIAFDHDMATNPGVMRGAKRLAAVLRNKGADAAFMWVPAVDGDPKTGIDDYLATANDKKKALKQLIASATTKFEPPEGHSTPVTTTPSFFDTHGLRTLTVARALHQDAPFAYSDADGLLTYNPDTGIYETGKIGPRLARLLGERYRSSYVATVTDAAINVAMENNMVIPDEPDRNWICVADGMLNLTERRVHPHDPKYLATHRLPVAWDPTATMPTIRRYLDHYAPDQADIVLDVFAQLFVPGLRQPARHLFLIGGTRTGKSTTIGLLVDLVGKLNTSAQTLHAFASDKFAAAEVHRKLVNAAADLSAEDVADMSIWKAITGGDQIPAQRKYGQPFTFTSRALFVFSANSIPWMKENSGAVLARLVPVAMPVSFDGNENATITEKLTAELPGLLTELVNRAATWTAPKPIAPVMELFTRSSDKVRAFLAEATEPATEDRHRTPRSAVWNAYQSWSDARGYPHVGRNSLYDRLEAAGYPAIRTDSGFVLNLTIRTMDEWDEVSGAYTEWRNQVVPGRGPFDPDTSDTSETETGLQGPQNTENDTHDTSDDTGSEPVVRQKLSELSGVAPAQIGPCTRCKADTIRYGPGANPWCADCQVVAS
jgi:putative DNA primase/helicase